MTEDPRQWRHLDDDSRSAVRQAREYLERELVPRIAECEAERRFPYELMGGLLDLGYVRGVCPAEDGGTARTNLENALLMEEAGRVWASLRTTMNILCLVAELLSAAGTREQKEEYLLPLLAGRRRGWFGLTEAEAGSDAGAVATVATALPDGSFKLRGRKQYITNAADSDFGIVMARTETSGITAFLVDQARRGIEIAISPRLSMRGAASCTVTLDDVIVPSAAVLGEPGRGLALALHAVNGGRLNVAAGAVGLGQACLEAAIEHSTERSQFGRALGGFQLVQELIVGMSLRTQAGRLLYQDAARALDAGLDARTECSMAKLFCTESAVRTASDNVQLHGASGLEEGSLTERYFRDAREATIPEGTSQMQILLIGRSLLGVSAVK